MVTQHVDLGELILGINLWRIVLSLYSHGCGRSGHFYIFGWYWGPRDDSQWMKVRKAMYSPVQGTALPDGTSVDKHSEVHEPGSHRPSWWSTFFRLLFPPPLFTQVIPTEPSDLK